MARIYIFIIVFGFIILILGIFSFVLRRKCPKCKKVFTTRKLSEDKVVNFTTDSDCYKITYICDNCGHLWSHNEEKSSDNY